MTIALIRHAARERYADNVTEEDLPLTDEGRTQASALDAKMVARGIRPELYLTSQYLHAQQTGDILRDLIDHAAALIQLRTSTSHEEYDFQGIPTEARESGHDVSGLSTIALVLHHPRVNQLLEKLTSQPSLRSHSIQKSSAWPLYRWRTLLKDARRSNAACAATANTSSDRTPLTLDELAFMRNEN